MDLISIVEIQMIFRMNSGRYGEPDRQLGAESTNFWSWRKRSNEGGMEGKDDKINGYK